ncbi:YARHG domain-containing protein [Longimicrobium sp.]|uniref:YARHG domain-containing protein n=1 Tax=Longimicrobium sp. TaxID=2029185 RepID=UPI002CFE0CFD|nr:YARHG domain-containing protein [Longimicrobium sp.]HSU12760.1 YARHG domain-containing protein [Longimicrobium sp.]
MEDAPPRGTSWQVWAVVTITVALLSGPVIPRVIDHVEQQRAHMGPSSLPVSERLLTFEDLQGKSSWDLDVLRNEIYARHGRRFENRALQSYFDSQPWYKGVYSPDRFREDQLNPVERANASLIREFQSSRH